MSASIREQVAEAIERALKAEAAKTPNHGYWLARKYDISSDAALAVVRDAVLAEIDRRIVPVTWITPGKYMARNEALTDLRAAVAELLGA